MPTGYIPEILLKNVRSEKWYVQSIHKVNVFQVRLGKSRRKTQRIASTASWRYFFLSWIWRSSWWRQYGKCKWNGQWHWDVAWWIMFWKLLESNKRQEKIVQKFNFIKTLLVKRVFTFQRFWTKSFWNSSLLWHKWFRFVFILTKLFGF